MRSKCQEPCFRWFRPPVRTSLRPYSRMGFFRPMKLRFLRFSSLLAALALTIACEGEDGVVDNGPPIARVTCRGRPAIAHTGTVASSTWTRDTAHILRGSVLVQGALTIQRGALVCADSGAALVIVLPNGSMFARGTASNPITFTALDPLRPWAGISLQSVPCTVPAGCIPDRSILSSALIEHAENGVYGVDVIRVDSTHFRQIRCTAARVSVLVHSTVDTAGIDGCSAV